MQQYIYWNLKQHLVVSLFIAAIIKINFPLLKTDFEEWVYDKN